MNRVWQLIFKNHVFLVFLVLQFLALSMLFSTNNYHKTTYINSTNKLVGVLFEKRSEVSEYLKLQEDNQRLALENAQLKSERIDSYLRVDENIVEYDSGKYVNCFQYRPAKVVNNSVNRKLNFITLNQGETHGIERGMGVITEGSIVGMVKDVSDHYCSVMPVINQKFSTNVRIKRTQEIGNVIWEGHDPRLAKVTQIPKQINLQIGDTIVTSGFSNHFPENILVGTVKEFSIPEGQNYYLIDINLSTNFSSLSYVEIIDHKFKDEIIELEQRTEEND